jgi:cold-inducible RNA-binding protein
MTSIYVGNLSYSATASDVRHAFVRYGKVSKVSIVTDDETGDSRGFAFVEMPDDKQAATAIRRLNHCQFRGQSITVHQAPPNADRAGEGRGRGW